MAYLNFNSSNCKNCYKCLRDCPVKAISVIDEKARITEELCILCGRCAGACRFNAKEVVSDIGKVKALFQSGKMVCVSVAPAFISSFNLSGFKPMEAALKKLGFYFAEETAVGAAAVTSKYKEILDSKKCDNLIASACPAIVRLIQLYYPDALQFLAQADSPMVAHAKMLKARFEGAKVVFVGPCIAKKREGDESGVLDAVLTFDELHRMLEEANVTFDLSLCDESESLKSRYYPINRGIIKSFEGFTDGYEYISVDGVARAKDVLSNIGTLKGMFIEMHACEFSCINGPCAQVKEKGGFIKATEEVRKYTRSGGQKQKEAGVCPDITANYQKLPLPLIEPPEYEIRRILEATGKFKPEDELDCGSCGYATCRDKAVAVYNNRAQLDMCLPYMRERAESISFDIIQNSPNGILAVDNEFKIVDMNAAAAELLAIPRSGFKGQLLERYFNPTDFYIAMNDDKPLDNKKVYLEKTDSWAEMSIRKVKDQNLLFCIMKNVTEDMAFQSRIDKLKRETFETTDEVIDKQMRVVQEIASLLGETAAETKIALLKLKETLRKESPEEP